MGITASSCFGVSMHLLYQRKMVSLAQTLAIIAGLWALLAIIDMSPGGTIVCDCSIPVSRCIPLRRFSLVAGDSSQFQ
jgi:hypothetical protein